MSDIEKRIKALRKCANDYETDGTSSLTDAEYDKEYYSLKDLAPDHSFFSEVGGLDEEHMYRTEVKHEVTMGSLSKSRDIGEFTKWMTSTFKGVPEIVALIEHKIDGSALSLVYKGGKLFSAQTRGDGFTGIDVTKNAPYISGVQMKIPCKEEVEVRGECYKNRDDFYENWVGKYKNPRNFTAGAVNQKNPLVTKERGIQFVAYEAVRKEFDTEVEKIEFLKKNGFTLFAQYKVIKGDSDYICQCVEQFMSKCDRPNLPYDIDGAVFKINDIVDAQAMGTTDGGKKPKSSRAIKFPTEQKETILEDIEWSIGRIGTLTPVGILQPVELAGTTVQRVSFYNLDFLAETGLQIGCKILMEKAGEIIPRCVRKLEDGDSEIEIPNECPSCGSKLEWDKKKVTKWCKNSSCPAQLNGNIEHWFKKLGVKGIGPGIIKRLTSIELNSYDEPVVQSISDMYHLNCYSHPTSLLSQSFGKRAFANILKSVNSVKEISLAKFIESLGIGKIGRMAKDITEVAPTLEDIEKLTVADLVKIEGFAEIKATAFINGWKSMKNEIEELLKHITIKEIKPMSSSLDGKKFCFTGSFKNPTRKEMEALVPENGGKVGSVGKSLSYLVWDGEIRKGKVIKAETLGIPIIEQADFMEMI